MKKFALFILFFFCKSLFCQEYHFDGFLEYKNSISGNNSLYFYNSNNKVYYLNVYKKFETIYGGIRDTENKILHEYGVTNKVNSIKFNYLFSRKLKLKKNSRKYFYDITEKKIDSSKTEVIILVYNDKKKKKSSSKIELIIDNSELIANENILFSFTDGIVNDVNSKITPGIPISIKVDFPTGLKCYYTLIKKEKTNTILTVDNVKIKNF
ncbi:hypothetical protein [Flavobacterium dankookense]|uniref:Uncharacterized protein n=1 Tax=Flavobacterium dankookense TaxID=706186 RepID=A0A4R6QFF5_9FLAO|nr:hypothetical protein [Flavobacterium dankookense]TDP61100.1 hypothetical protein BC748_0710 [Flavobacterium dankookense]